MLDTWCFSTFRLRTPHMCSIVFRSGDILGHSITFTFSSKAVVILAVYSGGYVGKQFLRGGHHLLLQNVSKCWNPCFPQLTTALQYQQLSCSPRPPCLTLGKTHFSWYSSPFIHSFILLTRASPHMLDTIGVKQVYLRLIRPQDMVPVIHDLGQVVFSKLFAGFFVSQLQKRLPSGTMAM